MTSAYNIIIKPYLTEKVVKDSESFNKVVFLIDRSANKIQIKKAIQDIFKVTVLKVNIINQSGKKKRLGKHEGRVSAFKKAVLTLKRGDEIEYFGGA